MTWTRLSDTFRDDPALLECSRDARLLQVEALVWCNQHLTDGVLPFGALARITDSPAANAAAAELEAAGVWSPIPDRNAWQIDWEDQEPAEDVKRRKALHAARQRRYEKRQAERQELHLAGDHSMCDRAKCPDARAPKPSKPDASGDASGDASRDASPDALPSRPVPSLTETGTDGSGAPDRARAEADTGPLCVHCSLTETGCRAVNGLRPEGKPNRHAFTPPDNAPDIEPPRGDLAAYGLEPKTDTGSARGSDEEKPEPLEDPIPLNADDWVARYKAKSQRLRKVNAS